MITYVKDVVEIGGNEKFPEIGEDNTVYAVLGAEPEDTKFYWWDGKCDAYAELYDDTLRKDANRILMDRDLNKKLDKIHEQQEIVNSTFSDKIKLWHNIRTVAIFAICISIAIWVSAYLFLKPYINMARSGAATVGGNIVFPPDRVLVNKIVDGIYVNTDTTFMNTMDIYIYEDEGTATVYVTQYSDDSQRTDRYECVYNNTSGIIVDNGGAFILSCDDRFGTVELTVLNKDSFMFCNGNNKIFFCIQEGHPNFEGDVI